MMFLFFIANLDQMKDGLILGWSMIIAGFAVFFYLIYFLVVKLK
jgi:hypothetical protein